MKIKSAEQKDDILRAVHFQKPQAIPMTFKINSASWNHYPKDSLEELILDHPILFPEKEKHFIGDQPIYSPFEIADKPYTDSWGCTWTTATDGITGFVNGHPLENWDNFDTCTPPDPNTDSGREPIDWAEISEIISLGKEQGKLIMPALRHGHTFLTLSDMRGYENLLYDMASEEPRLKKLIKMIEDFNYEIVKRYIELGTEWMSYPEDLGMQVGPMLSPKHFQQYIKPSYKRLITPAHDAGCIVHMHSDGDIKTLIDDLLDLNINIINLQDLVNGIDWIKEKLAGRVCIDLDIDRQNITPFGTPQQIDELILQEVKSLATKQGGLIMTYGLYPEVPLENVKALMDAMEKYSTYYT